jgi:NAD(P)-dependent dehydrogenase (short-subunit alcohol dehydrogenase family)
MVNAGDGVTRVALFGTEGALARCLAEELRQRGSEVVGFDLAGAQPGRIAAQLGDRPIGLAIFADDYAPSPVRASELQRSDMRNSLERLTFLPFAFAGSLRPALRKSGGGKLVLLSRRSARMEHVDTEGEYLQRPFRAAAHALWRCLSVEWCEDGIECLVIALKDAGQDAAVILDTITTATADGPVELLDEVGLASGW